MKYTHEHVLDTIGSLSKRHPKAAKLMRQLYNDAREHMEEGIMRLTYHDSEGLLVELSSAKDDKFIVMDVSRNETSRAGETQYIASCQFLTIGHAQAIARLLVGIEIQPDGAAWKRGPRSVARPTDARGNILHPTVDGTRTEEQPDPLATMRNCRHPATTGVAGKVYCDDCGAEVQI